MADKTGISWTDATWNPVRGCSRVSEGCRNCYAERVAARFSGPGQPYEGLARIKTTIANNEERDPGNKRSARWTGEVRLIPEHLADPLRWKKPRRIFVNSMSDLFHESLTNEQIAAVFGVMAAAPQHTFQVLTKRARRCEAIERQRSQAGGLTPECPGQRRRRYPVRYLRCRVRAVADRAGVAVKRWDSQAHDFVEDPRVDAFLAEVVEVCRKHDMSLGHEDQHGSFIVHDRADEEIYRWLSAASIDRSKEAS